MDTRVWAPASNGQPGGDPTTTTRPQDGISSGGDTPKISRPVIAGIVVSAAGALFLLVALLWRWTRSRKFRYSSLYNAGDGSLPTASAEKLSQQRSRRYKGSTWKRVSPFDICANLGRRWSRRRSSHRLEPSSFDTEVFVASRDQPATRALPDDPERHSGAARRSTTSDMNDEGIPDEDYRTIVNNCGVTLSPGTLPRLEVDLPPRFEWSDVRSSTRSNFGTDYKDEEGPADPESGIDGPYTHYCGYRTPTARTPVADLIRSPNISVETTDSMDTPARTNALARSYSLRSLAGSTDSERRMEMERDLADQTESEWAMPHYREQTRYEDPPDYAATVASSQEYR
ncbi:hypothetical protein AAF712_007182 [Marasmius tenuissimus]|uniref:Uncharacterized protein n=1 Tax=Marasmius tenuissimus TaxID=585030 RepID=A0ABR2ZWZ4_9AGAR